MHRTYVLTVQTIVVSLATIQAVSAKPLTFHVTLDPAVQKTPFTGRVYVAVSKDRNREPRLNVNNWFNPPTIFATEVTDAQPGKPIIVRPSDMTFPVGTVSIEPGDYNMQAFARRSLDHPVPGQGAGDLYSEAVRGSFNVASPETPAFLLNRVVEAKPFKESDQIKLVEFESKSLSRFHKRRGTMRAAVVLPKGWTDDAKVRHPVLYWIPGFSGSHRTAHRVSGFHQMGENASAVMIVVPDPTCYYGHSVFADSQTNGPWGTALIEELIPEVEKRFHGALSGEHRYVAGISSGGWSSLWLQITYPDSFSGCWAHAPDPVDFRDFQQIDLYKSGSNMYTDPDGQRRPVARQGEKVMLWYDDFVRFEHAIGPGGQIQSFEGVFSKRQPNGKPESLFDRTSGNVDQNVAKSWEKYDIRLVLERNWQALKPKLAGKLHVYGGGKDSFYLEGAVARLEKSLTKLGSDADVRVIPEMGHGLYRESVEPMFNAIVEKFPR